MAKSGMAAGLFAPAGNKADSKQKTTDLAFRAIVDSEASARDAKTERLRLLRLARENAAPAEEPVLKKKPARARAK
ncbi:MAG: hypothetical protein AB7I52_18300 [Rhizobiaceae bacterium]